MSPKKAFGILAGIFGLAVGLGVIGGIAGWAGRPPEALASRPDPAKVVSAEGRHRMWVAEQIANRLNEKVARARRECDLARGLGMTGIWEKKCKATDLVGPTLTLISAIASDSNAVMWTMAIDAIRDLEADLERH